MVRQGIARPKARQRRSAALTLCTPGRPFFPTPFERPSHAWKNARLHRHYARTLAKTTHEFCGRAQKKELKKLKSKISHLKQRRLADGDAEAFRPADFAVLPLAVEKERILKSYQR